MNGALRGVVGAFHLVRITEYGALEWPGDMDLCGDAVARMGSVKAVIRSGTRMARLSYHHSGRAVEACPDPGVEEIELRKRPCGPLQASGARGLGEIAPVHESIMQGWVATKCQEIHILRGDIQLSGPSERTVLEL